MQALLDPENQHYQSFAPTGKTQQPPAMPDFFFPELQTCEIFDPNHGNCDVVRTRSMFNRTKIDTDPLLYTGAGQPKTLQAEPFERDVSCMAKHPTVDRIDEIDYIEKAFSFVWTVLGVLVLLVMIEMCYVDKRLMMEESS